MAKFSFPSETYNFGFRHRPTHNHGPGLTNPRQITLNSLWTAAAAAASLPPTATLRVVPVDLPEKLRLRQKLRPALL